MAGRLHPEHSCRIDIWNSGEHPLRHKYLQENKTLCIYFHLYFLKKNAIFRWWEWQAGSIIHFFGEVAFEVIENLPFCINLFRKQSWKSLTIYQQLWSFLVLCKILWHYKSLAPSKSMPQKRNHDFTERSPSIKAGTYEPTRIKDILIQNQFFCRTPAF